MKGSAVKKPESYRIDGKRVSVYTSTQKDVPYVYVNSYFENGAETLEASEKLRCDPFHLVSISELE